MAAKEKSVLNGQPASVQVTEPLTPQRIERVEAALLERPQRECPVVHRFGPGVYLREVSIPAGTLVVGHHHRHDHVNIMLKGHMTFLADDGTTVERHAPLTIAGKPGRKIAYANTDTIWVNVYATNETNVAALEEQLFIKSDVWQHAHQARLLGLKLKHDADRLSYNEFEAQCGMSRGQIQSIVTNESDLCPFPADLDCRVVVDDSPIHGKGLFATAGMSAGDTICVARVGNFRTPAGRYANHSANPNAKFLRESGDIFLVATRAIAGAVAGEPGDEITVDYNEAIKLATTKELK